MIIIIIKSSQNLLHRNRNLGDEVVEIRLLLLCDGRESFAEQILQSMTATLLTTRA
jgi:hypothetical protein